MRSLLALLCLILPAIAQPDRITAVLSQPEIESLERKVAEGDSPAAQALLGKNYALTILGVTALEKFDRVAGYDPAKAAGEFSSRAKAQLLATRSAAVAAEGGQWLSNWSTGLFSYRILSLHQTTLLGTYEAERKLGALAIEHAIELDPTNEQWRMYHGYLLNFQSNQKGADLKTIFQAMKTDLAVVNGFSRSWFLPHAAKLAVRAREWSEAKILATELLKSATPEGKLARNPGNDVYDGNTVLGLVALNEGDWDGARRHLLAAGATKGSPQLDSFGPNMTLAKELIVNGERAAVLEFFKQCAVFWKNDRGQLEQWSKQVRANQTPDFGSNLVY